jgi:competence protein ComEC
VLATRQTAHAGGPLGTALVALAAPAGALAAGALGFTAAQMRDAAVAALRPSAQVGPVGVEGWVVDATIGASRRASRNLDHARRRAASPFLVRLRGHWRPAPTTRRSRLFRTHRRDRLFLRRLPRGDVSIRRFDRLDALGLQISALRRAVTETIAHASPGQGGARAAALVTGDRSLIDPETNRVFRDSGLGHMISVSGPHMGLVAGMIYGGLYFLLALIAPLALRFPISKWAAFAAILGTGAYLILSGNSVPAQRAFVMIAVAMGAILIDRPAITMRGSPLRR